MEWIQWRQDAVSVPVYLDPINGVDVMGDELAQYLARILVLLLPEMPFTMIERSCLMSRHLYDTSGI